MSPRPAGTALIVGASRGLGRGLVEEHRERGWNVIGTVRTADPGPGRETLDVTDAGALDELRERLPRPLDRLFVVAGVAGPDVPIGDVDPSEFAAVLHTNVLGPLRVVGRLADRVAPRGTVAVMSSWQGSITLNDSGGQETYRVSKAALNMGLRSLAARRDDARTYLAVNPGHVRTDMTGADAPLSVAESVAAVTDVLDARAGRPGTAFVDVTGGELPW